ncbi:MAG: hypothetical protein CMB97_01815 [Flavobacteriaceae bacterium]|nr:hypothetical protein [Flavobacteriaceae bacterium]
MPLKKFTSNDIFYNTIKTYPAIQIDVYGSKTYYQNATQISGAFTASVPCIPPGNISLYELNVDRNEAQTGLIYPFLVKNGTLSNFKTISTSEFANDFGYGDTLTGSYPLSASISREYWPTGVGMPGGSDHSRAHVFALQNTLNYYQYLSKEYLFGDKGSQELSLISIPSIFYGTTIKKGSVDLKFYISGSLIGQLQDIKQNGELIQVTGSAFAQSQGSGSCAGVVLYNEGFLVLTGSWPLETGVARDYRGDSPTLYTSSWVYFGAGLGGCEVVPTIPPGACQSLPGDAIPEVNFRMDFKGTQNIPTVTMFAHADKGEFNYSNNPTYILHSQSMVPTTGAYTYLEPQLDIKNTVESPYPDPTGSFKKVTYISKIGIYDEMGNLIGIAGTSTPVKKTEGVDYTFKLKLDF